MVLKTFKFSLLPNVEFDDKKFVKKLESINNAIGKVSETSLKEIENDRFIVNRDYGLENI